MHRGIPAVAVLAAFAAACASAPDMPAVAPDYTPLAGQPASTHARFYADCIRQAADTGLFRQVIDGGDELLLFTCTGAPARAFYDALGPHSDAIGSAFRQNGRAARSTAVVQRNLIGVDYCSVDAAGGDPTCIVTFNAGDFLIAGD